MVRDKQAENLIIDVLAIYGHARYNELFREIHAFQKRNPKQYRTKLSKRTFDKYLKALIEQGIVKNVGFDYELNEKESMSWVYGKIIEHFDMMLTRLRFVSNKPFFNLPKILPEIGDAKLREIRDVLQKTVTMIDRYLLIQQT